MPGHGQAFGYTVFFTGRGLGTLYKLMLYLHPDKKFSQNQPQNIYHLRQFALYSDAATHQLITVNLK